MLNSQESILSVRLPALAISLQGINRLTTINDKQLFFLLSVTKYCVHCCCFFFFFPDFFLPQYLPLFPLSYCDNQLRKKKKSKVEQFRRWKWRILQFPSRPGCPIWKGVKLTLREIGEDTEIDKSMEKEQNSLERLKELMVLGKSEQILKIGLRQGKITWWSET